MKYNSLLQLLTQFLLCTSSLIHQFIHSSFLSLPMNLIFILCMFLHFIALLIRLYSFQFPSNFRRTFVLSLTSSPSDSSFPCYFLHPVSFFHPARAFIDVNRNTNPGFSNTKPNSGGRSFPFDTKPSSVCFSAKSGVFVKQETMFLRAFRINLNWE